MSLRQILRVQSLQTWPAFMPTPRVNRINRKRRLWQEKPDPTQESELLTAADTSFPKSKQDGERDENVTSSSSKHECCVLSRTARHRLSAELSRPCVPHPLFPLAHGTDEKRALVPAHTRTHRPVPRWSVRCPWGEPVRTRVSYWDRSLPVCLQCFSH